MSDIIGSILEIVMEVIKASHDGIMPPNFELEPHLHIKDMCDKLEVQLSAMQKVCDKVKPVYEAYAPLRHKIKDSAPIIDDLMDAYDKLNEVIA